MHLVKNLQPLKVTSEELLQLQEENIRLRESLQRVQAENERLHLEFGNRIIILETFEGEAKLKKYTERIHSNSSLTLIAEGMLGEEEAELCSLDENACPLEPTVSFGEAFRDRALWLVGLLALQSCSGFILARNEALLTNHPVSKLVIGRPFSQRIATGLTTVTAFLTDSHLFFNHVGGRRWKRWKPS
jgi:hypothetical protein